MNKTYESLRVFKNPFLERLTHVHPLVPLLVWGPVVAWGFWRCFAVHHLNFSDLLAPGIIGLFSWTLVEYGLHRFAFHFKGKSELAHWVHFMLHGSHHADPQDPTRLVMPPAASILLGVLLYQVFEYFMGPVTVDPFYTFFIIGYLCYDYIHFGTHHFRPRTPVGRYLKQWHMDHHFLDSNTRWGVSSPLWDYVFGTAHSEAKKHQAIHS